MDTIERKQRRSEGNEKEMTSHILGIRHWQRHSGLPREDKHAKDPRVDGLLVCMLVCVCVQHRALFLRTRKHTIEQSVEEKWIHLHIMFH